MGKKRPVDAPEICEYDQTVKAPSQSVSENKRRVVRLAIRSDLLREAKALNLDVSRAAEAGIEPAIKKAKEDAWLAQNKDAIDAHNARIDAQGTPKTA